MFVIKNRHKNGIGWIKNKKCNCKVLNEKVRCDKIYEEAESLVFVCLKIPRD